MHPRNRHTGRYDFGRLIEASPELAQFARPNPLGDLTVDFTDPRAVRALNFALLRLYYGLIFWDFPPEFLCPPVPGRADYIHALADLIGFDSKAPRGAHEHPSIRVLDVGTGASLIYPIIGQGEYGWNFVATEAAPPALASARAILARNPQLAGAVEIREQVTPSKIFEGMIRPDERFDLTMCNPPFHASADAAREGTRRKWKNLGQAPAADLNFGGTAAELWCPGGEVEFIGRMIRESAPYGAQIGWFTTLVSKSENLPAIARAIGRAGATRSRVIEMAQGQKKSRMIGWGFGA